MSTAPTELVVHVESIDAALDSGNPLAEPDLHPAVAERLLEMAKRSGSKSFKVVFESSGDSAGVSTLPQAVRNHFEQEAEICSQRIRENFRHARRATLIGLGVVAIFLGIAAELPEEGGRFITVLRESLTIFAWVTMWRPAELWLYDHLPDRRQRLVVKRLANAEVGIR